jgi:hypothetical protein
MTDEVTQGTRSRKSVAFTILGTLIVLVATLLYVLNVMYKPAYGADPSGNSAISTTSLGNGQKMYTIHLAIQQQVGAGPHADWLGYQTETNRPHPGTMFDLPRNALVTMIIHNYDSQTETRNHFFTLVQGTVGGIAYAEGKRFKVMDPMITSHTFTIPDFGVSVPMQGISDSAKAGAYTTMKFTFRTPNRKGVFSWQCIVPCGSGLYGFGGPMGEIGYMQGLITLS